MSQESTSEEDSYIEENGNVPLRPFQQRRVKAKTASDFWGVQSAIAEGPVLWKFLLSELLGTMILTFIGCASCLTWDPKHPPTVLSIGFCIGTARSAVTQALGHISSFIIAGYFQIVKGSLYIIFQCLGSIMGALLLALITPKEVQGNLGCTIPNPLLTPLQAIVMEAVITMLLVLTVFSIADEVINGRNGSGRLELGFVITTCHIAAIQFTGSSMNPARSLGPAVVANIWVDHYIYWVGPILGGTIAAFIYASSFFMGKPPKKVEEVDDPALDDDFTTLEVNPPPQPLPISGPAVASLPTSKKP